VTLKADAFWLRPFLYLPADRQAPLSSLDVLQGRPSAAGHWADLCRASSWARVASKRPPWWRLVLGQGSSLTG